MDSRRGYKLLLGGLLKGWSQLFGKWYFQKSNCVSITPATLRFFCPTGTRCRTGQLKSCLKLVRTSPKIFKKNKKKSATWRGVMRVMGHGCFEGVKWARLGQPLGWISGPFAFGLGGNSASKRSDKHGLQDHPLPSLADHGQPWPAISKARPRLKQSCRRPTPIP